MSQAHEAARLQAGRDALRRFHASQTQADAVVPAYVEREFDFSLDGDRIRGAVTGESAALEFLVARLDALVDGRVQFDGHETSPLESDY